MNDIALEIEKQVTARHTADMESDNWLSKTIRPILAIVVPLDYLATKWLPFACGISVPDQTLQATFRLMEWVMGFYLGFKGVERIAKNIGPLFKK
ncbi:MAG: hypothetical protein IT223_04235 [Crocinitomicaceae bacterium]|nr:hypothetical protein [Crocinitomicaceae bacterium]